MEAFKLLTSRNKLFIQVSYKAAFHFVNTGPTGTPACWLRPGVFRPPGTSASLSAEQGEQAGAGLEDPLGPSVPSAPLTLHPPPPGPGNHSHPL